MTKMYLSGKYFQKVVTKIILTGLLQGLLFLLMFSGSIQGQDYRAVSGGARNAPLAIPTITGPASVCTGATDNNYSTEPGMTDYTWTVSSGGTITAGDGTNSITVTWNAVGSQSISVTYNTASAPAILAVAVLSFSTVGISISASANQVCAGSTVIFTAVPVNGGSSPVYQWKVNGINVGSNSNTFSYIPGSSDVVACQLTSNLSCTTGNPATSLPLTMVVNPILTTGVFISASANPVCQGTQVNFIAVPFNGGTSPVYQWQVNGISAGINSSGFSYLPVNGDVVICQMTSNVQCP